MKRTSILFYDTQAVHIIKDPSFPSGGAVRQVLAWAKGLNEIGIKTSIMGPHDEPEYFEKYDNIIIPYQLNKGVRILRYFYIRIPRIIIGLYKSKADYIYFGIPGHTAGLLALLTKILRKKFILRISSNKHVNEIRGKRRDVVRSLFFRFGFHFSNYIICQNDYQFARLRELYPDKTYKLKNPFIGAVSDHYLPVGQRKYIVWIGRFTYAKNVPLLLRIAQSLPDVTFKIAGNLDLYPENDDYAFIKELHTLPNVILTGFLKNEDIVNLLRESYLLLNTSYYEGFSNTFLEAFSVGTPVFSRAQADPDNIIRNNKLGYVYNNIDDLKEYINNIINDTKEYDAIATNCIQYMKTNHNLMKQTYEFLNIIINDKRQDSITQYAT